MSIYKNLIGYGPRAKYNGRYYSILGPGLSENLEKEDRFDDEFYQLGNYFLNEEVASRRAFVETLSRKIFSSLNTARRPNLQMLVSHGIMLIVTLMAAFSKQLQLQVISEIGR